MSGSLLEVGRIDDVRIGSIPVRVSPQYERHRLSGLIHYRKKANPKHRMPFFGEMIGGKGTVTSPQVGESFFRLSGTVWPLSSLARRGEYKAILVIIKCIMKAPLPASLSIPFTLVV